MPVSGQRSQLGVRGKAKHERLGLHLALRNTHINNKNIYGMPFDRMAIWLADLHLLVLVDEHAVARVTKLVHRRCVVLLPQCCRQACCNISDVLRAEAPVPRHTYRCCHCSSGSIEPSRSVLPQHVLPPVCKRKIEESDSMGECCVI